MCLNLGSHTAKPCIDSEANFLHLFSKMWAAILVAFKKTNIFKQSEEKNMAW